MICKSDISLLRLRGKGVGGWSELTTRNHTVGSFVCCFNTHFTEAFLAGLGMPSQCHEQPVPGYPCACSSCFPPAWLELNGGTAPCQLGCIHALSVQPHHLYFYTDACAEPRESVSSSESRHLLLPRCFPECEGFVGRSNQSRKITLWKFLGLPPTAARAAPVSDCCVIQVSSTSGSSC